MGRSSARLTNAAFDSRGETGADIVRPCPKAEPYSEYRQSVAVSRKLGLAVTGPFHYRARIIEGRVGDWLIAQLVGSIAVGCSRLLDLTIKTPSRALLACLVRCF